MPLITNAPFASNASAHEFSETVIAKCERLPKQAPYGMKILLLVQWHIAKSHKEASALLRAFHGRRRPTRSYEGSSQMRLPYAD